MSLRSRLGVAIVGASFFFTLSNVAFAQEQPAGTPPGGAPQTAAPGAGPTVNGQSVTERTTGNSPVDQFGGKGQIAISSDAALSIQSSSTGGVDGSTTTIMLAPALDYFVIQNLSIGGSLLFAYVSPPGDGSETRFGVGPRVGYNIPISDLVSIWPKAGLSIQHTSTSSGAVALPGGGTTAGADVSNTAVGLNLFAPVMFHPAPHFFAGFGPFLDTDLSGDNKNTTFGGKLTLGGWF